MAREISNETSDDIQMIASILTAGSMSGRDALDWLKTPQLMYSGLSPLEFMTNFIDGAQKIRTNLEKRIYCDFTRN